MRDDGTATVMSMTDMIRSHTQTQMSLFQRCKTTYLDRNISAEHMELWEEAKRENRKFEDTSTEVERFCARYRTRRCVDDPVLRGFSFAYLIVDPLYLTEARRPFIYEATRHMRRLELTGFERSVLRDFTLRRIRGRGRHDFQAVLRLLPKVWTEAFERELLEIARGRSDGSIRRARLALRYLVPHRYRPFFDGKPGSAPH